MIFGGPAIQIRRGNRPADSTVSLSQCAPQESVKVDPNGVVKQQVALGVANELRYLASHFAVGNPYARSSSGGGNMAPSSDHLSYSTMMSPAARPASVQQVQG
jgi:hypothetical protein